MLDGYCGSSLWAARSRIAERVGVYTASGLLKLVPEPFRYPATHWPEDTEKLLDRARKTLKSVLNYGSLGPSSPTGACPGGGLCLR